MMDRVGISTSEPSRKSAAIISLLSILLLFSQFFPWVIASKSLFTLSKNPFTMKSFLKYFRIAWVIVCLILPSTSAFSQVDSLTPRPNWEAGLRINQIVHNTLVRPEGYLSFSSKSRRLDAQVFLVRSLKKFLFVRGAAGLAYSRYTGTLTSVLLNVPDSDREFNTLSFRSEIGVGYELPASKRVFLNRLRLRIGFALTEMNTISDRNSATVYQYDTAGQLIGQTQSLEKLSVFELSGVAFFQVGFRVWKQLHLSLEWRNGPNFASFRRTAHNGGTVELLSSTSRFDWNTRVFTRQFSIGYAF
jgi:hypothetical protein